ncbi:hypothetical protein LEMLEM_LOCUS11081 [Lemmus lemmus]
MFCLWELENGSTSPHPVLITPKEFMLVVVALRDIIRRITLEIDFRSSGQSWPLGKGEA